MMATIFKLVIILLVLNYVLARIINVESQRIKVEHARSAMEKFLSDAQEINKNDYTPLKPSSCAELMIQGYVESGIYTIYPRMWLGKSEINVLCDMETDGGGWTVIQSRGDYLPRQKFSQNWEIYRRGFGQLEKEFWLGNENIYILTNQDYVTLRIDLADFEGDNRYVSYNEFQISDCRDRYRLKIGKFSGTTGDSLLYSNNATFSTVDDDNVNKCANSRKSGGWFHHCSYYNLNGVYLNGTTELTYQGVVWNDFKGSKYSLKKSEMKIRPTNFQFPLT